MDSNTDISLIDKEYEEAIQYLFSQLPMFSRVGAPAYKPGLEMTIALDNHFHNPHRKFKSIHIAGTNGKGSTAHNIAAILQAQNYKTALYTSPHLVDFRERMRINGKMIPKEKVIEFTRKWKKSAFEGHPSFFELTMMMAFEWFAEENVDYAVIEVGMGGRLDSTNIITPLLCAITNISFDHTQFLGNTLPAIAGEKAGIIKPGIPVVIGEAKGEVEKVFVNKALEEGSPLTLAYNNNYVLNPRHTEDYGWQFDTPAGETIHSPLGGEYQLKNLNMVLNIIEQLRNVGISIDAGSVKTGIEHVIDLTGFAGRWTIFSREPLVICDTGHNEAGLSYNMPRLLEIAGHRSSGKLRFLIGFVSDKNVDEILHFFPKNAEYYITKAAIPRAMPTETLHLKCEEHGITPKCYATVADAWTSIRADSSPADTVYVGGSTFIVADFLAL